MKIFHISDLHFGYHHHILLAHFLEEVKTLKPDLLIISGDITHRATVRQYADFCDFLKQIKLPVLIVPGNHDIPLYNIFSRLFWPFDRFKRFINPQLTVKWADDNVRLLGINSVNPYHVKDGYIPNETLDEIQTYFASSFKGLNLLFFHHNLVCSAGMHKPLQNFEAVVSALKNSAIDLVCTGHSHYASVKVIEKNDHSPFVILHAGSLSCCRSKDGLNSYYVIDIDNKHCRIDWRVSRNTHFESVETYPIDFLEDFKTL